MFDILHASYKKIITSIAIIGYKEEDILKCNPNEYNKLKLDCLYAFPSNNESIYNSFTYDMMFPNGDHTMESPKYFTLLLTNEKAQHTFLYCLKFSETYEINSKKEENNIKKEENKEKGKTNSDMDLNMNNNKISVPIIICIQSEKNDMEPFRQLLYAIHQIIMNENYDYDKNVINDYKKVELMNLFYFLFSLPHTSPHTNISLKLHYNKYNTNLSDNVIDYDIIDFYFSSNCEIPCNKIDTNIDLLFKILDQTIIIKVLFAILTEKQIIFRASEAYLLHIIIPTFLKLIFPFAWIQTSITILPKESIDYLDLPCTYIIGILSSTISLKDLLKQYPGKIIVDCDTNEMLGEEVTIPYYPKSTNNNNCNNNLHKSIKKKDEKDSSNNNNNGIIQGKNNFIVDGCYLYEYDQNFYNTNVRKRKKLKIDSKSNIMIDVEKSQLLLCKNYIYITSEEWKWIRKHVQMVRNPEIFDVGNIRKRKGSVVNVFFDNTKGSPIINERPFSYNIQNIFMTFILNKLEYPESDFMAHFKNSNLYLNYMEPKKYQNDSGKFIVDNINETKNEPRSFNNCFVIEYNLKPFNATIILEELEKKLNKTEKENDTNNNESTSNKNDNNSNNELYKQLKKVLMAYCVVLGMSMKQMNDAINFDIEKTSSLKRSSINNLITNDNRFNGTNYFSFSGNSFHIKKHIKNKTTYLNYNKQNDLFGIDENEDNNSFLFYGKNGFINFINDFEKYLKDENLDIKIIIYQKAINNQILHILKDLKQILKGKDASTMEAEINIDVLDNDFQDNNSVNENDNIGFSENIKSSKKKVVYKNSIDYFEEIKSKSSKDVTMSTVEEKKDEEDSVVEGSITKNNSLKFKINNKEYDLENILNNGINLNDEEDNLFREKDIIKNSNENAYQRANIINFPNYEKEETNMIDFYGNQNNSIIDGKNKIDLRAQYYLFIVYLLEDISQDDTMKKKIIEEIAKMYNIRINFDKLVLKLYKLAFDHSGKKHRDFPYFNFHEFLMGFSLENLKKIEDNIDKFQLELYDIYNFTIKEKKKMIEKEVRKSMKDISTTPTLPPRSITISDLDNKKEKEKDGLFNLKSSLQKSRRRESLAPNSSKANALLILNNKLKTTEEQKSVKKKKKKKKKIHQYLICPKNT